MKDDGTVELNSVVQRFKDSSAALEALRERLRQLELAGETQDRAAGSLESSSENLKSLTESVSKSVESLQTACAATEAALEAARRFLEGTDLASLRESVHDIRGVLDAATSATAGELADLRSLTETGHAALGGRVEQLTEFLTERLDQELASTRTELAQCRQAHADLQAKVAAMPAKFRKRFGL